MRGHYDEPDRHVWRVFEIVSEIRKTKELSAFDLHSLGRAMLLIDRTNDAIDALSSSLYGETGARNLLQAIARSTNAELLSDLGAAFLARAEATGSTTDRLNALEAAERGWTLRQSPDAGWNRALAIEAVNLPLQSREAWNDYLKLEHDRSWRQEAQTRAIAVGDRKGTSSNAESLLKRLEDSLLPRWATAVLAADRTAIVSVQDEMLGMRHAFTAAKEIAAANWISDVERLSRPESREVARHIADQIRHYDSVKTLIATGRYTEARQGFQMIEAAARSSGASPIWIARIQLNVVVCHYYLHDYARSRHIAETVLREAAGSAYIAATASWMIGLCDSVEGRIGAAATVYAEAIEALDDEAFPITTAALEGLYAGVLDRAGDHGEAWDHRDRALMLAGRSENGRARLTVIANEMARAAMRMRRHALAALLTEAVLGATPDTIQTAEAHLSRAALAAARGDTASAFREIAAARTVTHGIAEPSVRERIDAMADTAEAAAHLAADPVRAEALYDRAIAVHRKERRLFRLAELLVGKARAQERLGNRDAARRTLLDGLVLVNRESAGLHERSFGRVSPIAAEEIYRTLIGLALTDGRHDEALQLVCEARRRAIGRMTGVESGSPAEFLQALQRALRPNEILAIFGETDDSAVAWIVTSGLTTFQPVALVDHDVAAELQQLALSGGEPGDHAVERLHAAWFKDIRSRLAGYDRLLIVPSEGMQGTPFAALRERNGSRALVEEHDVVVLNDVRALIPRPESRPRPVGPVLVVDSSPVAEGPTPRLLAIENEIRAIRRFAGDDVVVLRRPAVIDVLRRISESGLVHLSGHAVADVEYPLMSYFDVSADGGRRPLYAGDVVNADLAGVGLVVLAACSSAARSNAIRPQSGNIAEAFVFAGVPNVIGSLGVVDDDATAVFFRLFYQELRALGDPVAAFSETQRRLLRSTDTAGATWLRFQLIGIPT
jgi:tetratricopeptide (TPR) repeat protein